MLYVSETGCDYFSWKSRVALIGKLNTYSYISRILSAGQSRPVLTDGVSRVHKWASPIMSNARWQHTCIFQVSVCVTFANTLLAKAGHGEVQSHSGGIHSYERMVCI